MLVMGFKQNGFANLWPALKVCWCCRASKGSNGLGHCYVNVHPSAAWRGTIGLDPPWEHSPAYCKLVAFDPLMISMDLLHIWHLGVGRVPRLYNPVKKYYVNGFAFAKSI